MAQKAGRAERNPLDNREKRAAKGTRTSRRQGTKSRVRKRTPRR